MAVHAAVEPGPPAQPCRTGRQAGVSPAAPAPPTGARARPARRPRRAQGAALSHRRGPRRRRRQNRPPEPRTWRHRRRRPSRARRGYDLGDTALVHHGDALGPADGREPVGDDQRRHPRRQLEEAVVKSGLEPGRRAAPLVRRARAPSLPGPPSTTPGPGRHAATGRRRGRCRCGTGGQDGAPSLRKPFDQRRRRTGHPTARSATSSTSDPEVAKGDVGPKTQRVAGEVLVDDRHLALPGAGVEVGERHAVDGDPARRRVPQAGQQGDEGGLAGAVHADDGQGGPGPQR